MKTLTIEIINEQALGLLKSMEGLNLIKFKSQNTRDVKRRWEKYKGTMSQQPLEEIETQLAELRNGWE